MQRAAEYSVLGEVMQTGLAEQTADDGQAWCTHLLKSFKSRPCLFCRSLHSSMASCRNSAICSKSASLRPLDVMAGAPMRTPPGVIADTSPTTAFLFRVMWHRSQHLSILLPVIFCTTGITMTFRNHHARYYKKSAILYALRHLGVMDLLMPYSTLQPGNSSMNSSTQQMAS